MTKIVDSVRVSPKNGLERLVLKVSYYHDFQF